MQASNGLRVSINEARNRQPEQLITVADLIDHYTETELAFNLGNEGKVARYEGCLQRVSRQVGEAHLGKAEHPRRSYHCSGTLASSTDVHRRPPDGSANESKDTLPDERALQPRHPL
jgi:hypothetical protein